MSDDPRDLTKPQSKRMDFLSQHGFMRCPSEAAEMVRESDGKKCLIDAKGMIYWLYTDAELKSDD